jgi:hypothetical protein
MPTDLLFPEDIDARLSWPPGTALRLARRGRLPHYVLPDESVRMCWAEIALHVRHVEALPSEPKEAAGV